MSAHPSDDPVEVASSVPLPAGAAGSPTSGSWRAIVLASGLPNEIQSLIRRVVRSAGGTPSERRETALELVSHFAAALESKTPVEMAIASFGDERAASRLLRRAIRRKRGLVWHSWWWASRATLAGIGCCIAVYAWWTALLLSAQPTVRVDYIGKLEALAASRATGETGWPLLRDAYATLRSRELPLLESYRAAGLDDNSNTAPLDCMDPASPRWALDEQAIVASDTEIRQLHAASLKESVTPPFNRFDADDQRFYGDSIPEVAPLGPAHELRLPHLLPIRAATRWLAADAVHAFHRGDHERALASAAAILRIGHGVHGEILVEQLVAQAIAARGLGIIAVLSDLASRSGSATASAAFFHELAMQIDSVDTTALRVRLIGEDLAFEDSLQRYFTDDGNGDGRVTREGLKATAIFEGSTAALLEPAAMALTPSRAELHAVKEILTARAERFASMPPWRWAEEFGRADLDGPSNSAMADYFTSSQSIFWLPRVVPTGMALAQLEVQRDRTRVGVALCRHHAQTGTWPKRLDELVPSFLRAVPPDPFDGNPMRYALRDGVPTVWVIGSDRLDQALPEGSELAEDASWINRFRDALERRWSDVAGQDARVGPMTPATRASDDIQLWPVRRDDETASKP